MKSKPSVNWLPPHCLLDEQSDSLLHSYSVLALEYSTVVESHRLNQRECCSVYAIADAVENADLDHSKANT
jgi:hypothetical protein